MSKFSNFLGKGIDAAGKVFGATNKAFNFAAKSAGINLNVPDVGGILAKNASAVLMGKKADQGPLKKANVQIADGLSYTASINAGDSPNMAKFKLYLSKAWAWIKIYWWIILPALIIVVYFVFFNKKKTYRRRARRSVARSTKPTAIRRRRKSKTRLSGSAFARKMRLAKLRKARARK
jgi:uncharacterized membrane protein